MPEHDCPPCTLSFPRTEMKHCESRYRSAVKVAVEEKVEIVLEVEVTVAYIPEAIFLDTLLDSQ